MMATIILLKQTAGALTRLNALSSDLEDPRRAVRGAGYRLGVPTTGAQLAVSHQPPVRDVAGAVAYITYNTMEMAERLRQVEFERCERLTCAVWPKMRNGDVPAQQA